MPCSLRCVSLVGRIFSAPEKNIASRQRPPSDEGDADKRERLTITIALAGSMAGRKHPQTHHQPPYSGGIGGGGGSGGGGGWGGGVHPRPSSARDPASHASLVYRKAAGYGSGGGGGIAQPDAMQVFTCSFDEIMSSPALHKNSALVDICTIECSSLRFVLCGLKRTPRSSPIGAYLRVTHCVPVGIRPSRGTCTAGVILPAAVGGRRCYC